MFMNSTHNPFSSLIMLLLILIYLVKEIKTYLLVSRVRVRCTPYTGLAITSMPDYQHKAVVTCADEVGFDTYLKFGINIDRSAIQECSQLSQFGTAS